MKSRVMRAPWNVLAVTTLCSLATAGAQEPHKLGRSLLQVGNLGEPTGVAFGAEPGSLIVAESLARRVVVLGPKGERLREIGVGLLRDPRDVARVGADRIAVCDAGAHSVFVFDATGKLVQELGGKGSRPGELLLPEGIDVQGIGVQGDGERIAVADSGNDRVQVFALDGELVTTLGGSGDGEAQMNRPADVAFGADGSLFVADLFHQRVQQFGKDGKLVRVFGTPGPNPGQFAGPTGLAVHGGFLHVVDRDNGRVQVFDAAGELDSWYGIHALRPREGEGKLHYPLRIALAADGASVLLSEPVENRVQVLGPVDPNAEELPPLPALPPSHYGGAVDADGPFVLLAEPSIPKVILFQMLDGEPIEIANFGVYGTRPGQLLWPTDVAVDFAARRIYVADSGALRISAYQFRFDPAAEIGFDPERVRFVGSVELSDAELPDFMDAFGKTTIEPAGMWRDGEGGLCVSDARRGAVWRFDADLAITGVLAPQADFVLGDGCAGPAAANAKEPREQYVVERGGGRVLALPSGKTVAEGFARPAGVLWTRAGELYVSDEGANALLRPRRAKPEVARGPGLGTNEVTKPRGLAEVPGGRVLAIDWGNHRGVIYDAEDRFVLAFGSQLFVQGTFRMRQQKRPEPAFQTPPAPPLPGAPTFDGSRPWHAAKCAVTNDGEFLVFWKPTPDPIEERKTFALECWVTRRATPNELAAGIGLSLDAAMPEHGHGMNVVPRTTREADGRFRVEGTRLHMPGRWELYFDVRSGVRTRRAQVTLQLD